MAFKFVSFAALLAVARAGAPLAYSAAPAVAYSSVSSPVGYASPALGHAYAAAPALAHSYAPVAQTYASPAYTQVAHGYAAPAIAKYAAPIAQAYASPAYTSVAHGYAAPAIAKYAAAPVAAYAAPVAHAYAPVAKAVYAQPEAPAHYDFGYSVNDPHTGDNKQQHETRRGDVVQGSYSLVDSDGTKRTVEYTADPHNGFNAVVHKEPLGVAVKAVHAPVAVAHAAPVAYSAGPAYAQTYAAPAYAQTYAAPAYAKVASPLAYAQPAYAKAAYYH